MASKSDILGYDHVQVLCPVGGEDAARSWWGDVVGLEEVPKPEPLLERGGVWFRCGSEGLHVGAAPDFAPAFRAHPALRVRSVEAFEQLAARLAEAGSPVEHAEVPIAERRMKTRDCFGNLIEFVVGSTG